MYRIIIRVSQKASFHSKGIPGNEGIVKRRIECDFLESIRR